MSRKPEHDDSAYSGRWVARIDGRIVGQGGTPDEARRSAGLIRHKEKAEVTYMYPARPLLLTELIHKIAAILPDDEVYLVGGAIRDSLLGRTSHDFDFVVPRDAVRLGRRVASSLGGDFYVLDEEFGAGRVILTSEDGTRDFLDFTSFRGESIQADLAARDFTINAMAMNVGDETSLDPLHGAADLRARIIRACSATSVGADPIRILRAVRLAADLAFRIESSTRQSMQAAAAMLSAISAERKRDELFRMLNGPQAATCMRALDMLGVFPHFLPELVELKGIEQSEPHVHDVWEHTLRVMGNLGEMLDLLLQGKVKDSDGLLASVLTLGIGRYRERLAAYFHEGLNPDRTLRSLLQFAALYHDVGKPATWSRADDGRIHFIGHERAGALLAAERGRQLKISSAEVKWIQDVISHHLRFFFLAARMEAEGQAPTRRAIYRFFRDAGPTSVALILLGLADFRGTRDHLVSEQAWSMWVGVARTLLESLWEGRGTLVAPAPLIDGNDLQKELALEPGPILGRILEAIREAQATGAVMDRAGAIAFAKEWIEQTGVESTA